MNTMYHISADKRKRKYGFISNMGFFIGCIWKWSKVIFFMQLLFFLPNVITSLLTDLMPARLVAKLSEHAGIAELLFSILLILAGILLFSMCANVITGYINTNYDYFPDYFTKEFAKSVSKIDYEKKEDPKYREIYDNAWETAMHGRAISGTAEFIPMTLSAFVGILVYGILIARKSVLLFLLLLVSVSTSMILLSIARKMHAKYFKDLAKYSKGEEYITEKCMDSAAGKDIRIYKMLDYILNKYDENLNHISKLYGRIHSWYRFRNILDALFSVLTNSFAYIYLINLWLNDSITAADFVFYLGAITSFSAFLEKFIREMMLSNSLNTSLSYFREFMETKSDWNEVSLIQHETFESMKKEPLTVELKDVSYTYPGSELPTINHINMKISAGEKLALIGLNGAGKTTLVKLLCGLYKPTKGTILINNIPMENYTRKEYLSLVSVLFQEASFLPKTVDANIISGTEYDANLLQKVLRLSGFHTKYENLSKKGETLLVKKVESEATDFSGGEKQKLLCARTLYKKAPLIILDEPTAALDPIAENELYMNLGEAMEGRSALYISHRLSSTRFCDRILLIEHGNIIEEGTHDSLMQLGGRYAELYEMQSKYYKENEQRKNRSKAFGEDFVKLQKGAAFNE